MRIAIWSSSYFKGAGGAEKIVTDLIRHLNLPGTELLLLGDLAPNHRKESAFFEPLPPGVEVYQNTFANPLLSSHQPLKFLMTLLRYFRASVQLAIFFSRKKVNIMHLHLVNIDVLLLVALKYLFRYQLVITFTGMELDLASAGRLSRLKTKIALKHADQVTTVSKDIQAKLNQQFSFSNAIHIQNGVDPEYLQRFVGEKPVSITSGSFIFCGRLHPVKRISFLIEAFHECLQAGCRRQLFIVGDGEDMPLAKSLTKQLGVEDRIIFTGAVPHEQVIQMMHQADCLLLSSASEGCPIVALEAMALGKPVIAPAVGGLPEIISHGENGFLFPANRPDVFKEFILKIDNDASLLSAMGLNARATVLQQYHQNEMLEKYKDIYTSLPGINISRQVDKDICRKN